MSDSRSSPEESVDRQVQLANQVNEIAQMLSEMKSHRDEPKPPTVADRPTAIPNLSGDQASNDPGTTGGREKKPNPEPSNPSLEGTHDRHWSVRGKERAFNLESCLKLGDPITKGQTYEQVKESIDLIRHIVTHHQLTYDDCFDIMEMRAPEFDR